MTSVFLEKLAKFISASVANGYPPIFPEVIESKLNELRALVKAESEPSFLDEYADEFYNHGGEPRESDVQAEGRGEFDGSAMYPGDISLLLERLGAEFPEEVESLGDAIMDQCHTIMRENRAEWDRSGFRSPMDADKDHAQPKPHNPDNLPSPVEGYRFLDEDEILRTGESIEEIERWFEGEWSAHWAGTLSYSTYRTRLTREQLAKKRKEAGR